jgi:hypothetical protein
MKNGDTVILKYAQSIVVKDSPGCSNGTFSIELDAGAIGVVVEDDTQSYTSNVRVRFRIINTFSVEKTISLSDLQEFRL